MATLARGIDLQQKLVALEVPPQLPPLLTSSAHLRQRLRTMMPFISSFPRQPHQQTHQTVSPQQPTHLPTLVQTAKPTLAGRLLFHHHKPLQQSTAAQRQRHNRRFTTALLFLLPKIPILTSPPSTPSLRRETTWRPMGNPTTGIFLQQQQQLLRERLRRPRRSAELKE